VLGGIYTCMYIYVCLCVEIRMAVPITYIRSHSWSPGQSEVP